MHVYTIFPFLPETRSTMEEVAAWARRNLLATTRGHRPPNKHHNNMNARLTRTAQLGGKIMGGLP